MIGDPKGAAAKGAAATTVLVVASVLATGAVAVDSPAYNAGTYYAGLCSDEDGYTFPSYLSYTSYDGEELDEQGGLDKCLEIFGDKVIGYSYESVFSEFTCYFDPDDVPDQPDDDSAYWYYYAPDYDNAVPPVAGGNPYYYPFESTCYNFLATPSCSAHILAAIDRTYAFRYPGPAKDAAFYAYYAAAITAFKIPFNEKVTFGVLDLERTKTRWRVRYNSGAANSPSKLLAKVIGAFPKLNAGSRAAGTKFSPLFKDYADELAASGEPGYILLFTDGVLLKPKRWKNYARLKEKMIERLGTAAPKILCYRLLEQENSEFLDAICDSTYYEGMNGLYDMQLAALMAEEICGGGGVVPAP